MVGIGEEEMGLAFQSSSLDVSLGWDFQPTSVLYAGIFFWLEFKKYLRVLSQPLWVHMSPEDSFLIVFCLKLLESFYTSSAIILEPWKEYLLLSLCRLDTALNVLQMTCLQAQRLVCFSVLISRDPCFSRSCGWIEIHPHWAIWRQETPYCSTLHGTSVSLFWFWSILNFKIRIFARIYGYFLSIEFCWYWRRNEGSF